MQEMLARTPVSRMVFKSTGDGQAARTAAIMARTAPESISREVCTAALEMSSRL